MSNSTPKSTRVELEDQDRDGLLQTTRRFLAELQSLSTRIAAVQEISTAINRSLNLDQILQVVGQQAKWLLDFDHCSICLCEPTGSRQLTLLFGEANGELDTGDRSPIGRSLHSRQPQLLQQPSFQPPNPDADDAIMTDADRRAVEPSQSLLRSQMIIPLESESEVLGTINFASRNPQAYTQEDIRIAYLLALQLSAAIRNARRFEEVNQLYLELQQAYADLRQLEGLRDELTHMIVHDLRNPLSSIIVGLEMADVTQNDITEHQRWIELAQTASNCMDGMIDDLLHLSKLEAGKLQPTLVQIDVATLVLAKEVSYRAQAQRENKTLLLNLPSHLPPVMADAGLVSRVIDNLVSNAFKYTDPGGFVALRISADQNELRVSVQDNGLGVPTEYCDRIFDKFVQVADATGATLRKGTGLGLSFCRMAIEAHNGKIWVESEKHRGSIFIFTLPLNRSQATLTVSQPSVSSANYPISNG